MPRPIVLPENFTERGFILNPNSFYRCTQVPHRVNSDLYSYDKLVQHCVLTQTAIEAP